MIYNIQINFVKSPTADQKESLRVIFKGRWEGLSLHLPPQIVADAHKTADNIETSVAIVC